jgi:organic hydroperoxide reductase OsmC/OhrA
MSEHKVSLNWSLEDDDFSYDNYSRSHHWKFEGGTAVNASAAKEFLGRPELVNPEEAFAASISSCHMLTFLAIASRKRYTVRSYKDEAVAILAKGDNGRMVVTQVFLRPEIVFEGSKIPTKEQIDKMHHSAHLQCFIAGSVTSEIVVEPVY